MYAHMCVCFCFALCMNVLAVISISENFPFKITKVLSFLRWVEDVIFRTQLGFGLLLVAGGRNRFIGREIRQFHYSLSP